MYYKYTFECKRCGEIKSDGHVYNCPDCGRAVRQTECKLIPEITDIFEYKGKRYRCTSFVLDYVWDEKYGAKGKFCGFKDATHVGGTGVCGVVANIEDVKWIEQVGWDEAVRMAHIKDYYNVIYGQRLV